MTGEAMVAMVVRPDCDGDGHFLYVGGPGYFSHSFGNYLPTERVVTCERCAGIGEVEVELEADDGA